ncbi:hypothetical protein RSOLAG22IIIB_01405 [Rhizoctonia solani]|uniref:Uncharacterized protein n=1 Tax=Rhizoctonia solani TaxID=456999 RepID=A0A0K6G688_9AGAM|nr:hypothetical protein RSOLAG22IIIB_01405 [Rhizoctonia solani]
MNGNPTHIPPNMSGGPPRRSGSSPAVGIVPTITSSLRNVILYNQNALSHAIAQMEAIGDIQNELVSARSAHAQVSKELHICMERNTAQSRQLLQAQDELTVVTRNLHGAREQLGLLESRLASVDGKALAGSGAQQDKASSSTGMATSAAIAAQHSDTPTTKADVLPQASLRVRAIERRFATVLGLPDQVSTMTTDRLLETLTGPNARTTSDERTNQIFAYFKALRDEFDTVVNAAQSYTSRNAMLEATITTIKGLDIGVAPTVAKPIVTDVRTMADKNTALKDSLVDGEIEMDVERTEAARVARKSSSTTPLAQPQPTVPPPIQPPEASRPTAAGSSTPTQITFFPQHTNSPQRKRQRTSTSGGTPEPLPRDDKLHVYIRLVSATYKVRPAGGASGGEGASTGQKELVCKLCE